MNRAERTPPLCRPLMEAMRSAVPSPYDSLQCVREWRAAVHVCQSAPIVTSRSKTGTYTSRLPSTSATARRSCVGWNARSNTKQSNLRSGGVLAAIAAVVDVSPAAAAAAAAAILVLSRQCQGTGREQHLVT